MKHLWTLGLATLLGLAACGGDIDSDTGEAADEVAVETASSNANDRADLALRELTGVTVPTTAETRRVFTTAASYRAFFGAGAPAVDFSREWVALYAAGVQRTGGYVASVTHVRPSGTGLTLKVTTRLESPGASCIVTQALTRPAAVVAFAIPSPRTGYVRYYRDDTTRDCNAPSCDTVRCTANTHCEVRAVQCVRAPCPAVAGCYPNVTCANLRCAAGSHCVEGDGGARCDVDPGACLADSDCLLYDNYCGGCACNALGHNQRPVTCTNPVACLRQPCGGLTAHCDTATHRCEAARATSAGVACGRNTCGAGEYCCNASCGTCARMGVLCIQRACL